MHTETPWFIGPTPSYLMQGQRRDDDARKESPITIRSNAHTEEICTVWNYLLPTAANAEFIVRACNAHYELVAALKALVDPPLRYNGDRIEIDCDSHCTAMALVATARAALAKATP